MKDFVANSQSLPESLFGGLSSKKATNVSGSDDVPPFDPALIQASSEERSKQFEQIDELTYKMVDEDDAYVTNRRSQTQPEEERSETKSVKDDSPSPTQQAVSVSDPVVNPHLGVQRLFVTSESINRHLAPFSIGTRGIITEAVQVIQTRLGEGKIGHTFAFDKPGIQVQFESDGDKLHVRVKGEMPLTPASEELIKNQAQLLGYLQEIFPDKELSVSLEPSTLPEKDGSGQDAQGNQADDQQLEYQDESEETE